jgi:hypothetical protein
VFTGLVASGLLVAAAAGPAAAVTEWNAFAVQTIVNGLPVHPGATSALDAGWSRRPSMTPSWPSRAGSSPMPYGSRVPTARRRRPSPRPRFADEEARKQGRHLAQWAFGHFLRPLDDDQGEDDDDQ